jgi:hypothetical protein
MKTGILFDDFMKSDKNYEIMLSMNNRAIDSIDDIIGFVINLSHKVIETHFAYTNISDISHFNNGLLIATSINTADCLNKASVTSQRVYYIWDMSWIGKTFNFYSMYNLLSNKKLKVLVRSELQAKVIKQSFGLDVDGIVPHFNLEKINEICS